MTEIKNEIKFMNSFKNKSQKTLSEEIIETHKAKFNARTCEEREAYLKKTDFNFGTPEEKENKDALEK